MDGKLKKVQLTRPKPLFSVNTKNNERVSLYFFPNGIFHPWSEGKSKNISKTLRSEVGILMFNEDIYE